MGRYGIGGGPKQTLVRIGQELGISKERVRLIEAHANARLRTIADEADEEVAEVLDMEKL